MLKDRPIYCTAYSLAYICSVTNDKHPSVMKTRRQYLAYVRKEEAAGVSPLFIMNEWEFRGHQTPAEQVAEWEAELDGCNARMLPLILAGEDHRDPMTDLFHMTGNARRIDNQIRAMETRFNLNQK